MQYKYRFFMFEVKYDYFWTGVYFNHLFNVFQIVCYLNTHAYLSLSTKKIRALRAANSLCTMYIIYQTMNRVLFGLAATSKIVTFWLMSCFWGWVTNTYLGATEKIDTTQIV